MLQLYNQSPFVPFLTVLPDVSGVDTLSVVVKSTFTIFPRVEIAEVQLPAVLQDQFWDEREGASLRIASDVHLSKPSTDVVLVGNAWSDRGPITELLASVAIAERRKTVRVVGDRRWRRGGAGFTAPEPFESMPLTYERAFGGVQTDDQGRVLAAEERNPVGVGFTVARSAGQLVGRKLPNLEDPRSPLRRAGDRPPPAGFGFVAASWLPRRRFAGTYDQDWARHRAPYLPRDFDPRFFNAAAPELVFDRFLTGGEPIELDGVGRRGPLRFLLPRVRPLATVWMAGQILTPQPRLETVLIEPEQERICLTWRATLPCDKAALKIRQVAITLGRD